MRTEAMSWQLEMNKFHKTQKNGFVPFRVVYIWPWVITSQMALRERKDSHVRAVEPSHIFLGPIKLNIFAHLFLKNGMRFYFKRLVVR